MVIGKYDVFGITYAPGPSVRPYLISLSKIVPFKRDWLGL